MQSWKLGTFELYFCQYLQQNTRIVLTNQKRIGYEPDQYHLHIPPANLQYMINFPSHRYSSLGTHLL
jgi:hypothetical protein